MKRMLATAAIASFSFATFAGCTEDAPRPTPTKTSAACSPSTAEVTWGAHSSAGRRVVAAYTLRDSGGSAWDVTFEDTGAAPEWEDSLGSGVALTDAEVESWHAALLRDANRTGQVGTTFGQLPKFGAGDAPPAAPSKVSDHEFVGVLTDRWIAMPFSVRCKPGIVATGTVSAASGAGTISALFQCDSLPHDDLADEAASYC